MEIVQSFLEKGIIETGLRILLLLFFAWFVMKLLRKLLQHIETYLTEKSKEDGELLSGSEKRIETILRLIKQACLLIFWLIIGLIVLKELKVEIGPIIASAGIIGIAIGFAAQNLVRDFISGFFIIMENQIRIGDYAILNGTGGTVEKIRFRTIVLRDSNGAVHIFPNGVITTISNLTKDWSAYIFNINVSYNEDIDRVIKIIQDVGQTLKKEENFGKYIFEDISVYGVDKFENFSISIKGRIKTVPMKQWWIGREFLRRIKYAFDENNIKISLQYHLRYFENEKK